ncbi:G-type lectin S-receptor-like serine/threonine-protein kinase [Tanacetum coccineum]
MLLAPVRSSHSIFRRVDAKSTSGESKEKDCSVNNMTISVVEGRYGTLKSDAIHIQYPVSIFKENETEAMSNKVVGTYGYISLEYAMEGTFSIKTDIFSFGVLILDIVSGRRNSSFIHLDWTFNLIEYKSLLSFVSMHWTYGNTWKYLCSTTILEDRPCRLLCVQKSATDRPTTSGMISMLLNDTMMLPTPNRAFVIGRVDAKSTSGESKEKDCSVNNMTITVVEGRYGTLKSDTIHI